MRRPGQAAATEDAHVHPEIAPVFLRHQVRRRFRRAKQRMQRAVDPAGFLHALVIFRARIVIASRKFLQRNLVGRVAINFVRAQKNEYGFGTMLPRGLQQIHGAQSVHLEIEQGNLPRFIVRRLRRAVHDQIETPRAKQLFHGRAVANVQRCVRKALRNALQPLQIPQRVARGPKKHAPHVVIYARDFVPLPVEILDRFGSDQPAAACNQNLFGHGDRFSKFSRRPTLSSIPAVFPIFPCGEERCNAAASA